MKTKIFQTAAGKRIRVRMNEREAEARTIYWMAVTVVPFFTSAAMTLIWIKGA